MRPTRFVVEGDARGYTTTNRAKKGEKRKLSATIRKYWKYCEAVRLRAKEAGLRKLPLEPTLDEPLMFFTRAYFKNGVHADPENVHKGIKDALCYKKGGGPADKYTGGHYLPPEYDAKNPRVEVIVRPKTAEDESEWDTF